MNCRPDDAFQDDRHHRPSPNQCGRDGPNGTGSTKENGIKSKTGPFALNCPHPCEFRISLNPSAFNDKRKNAVRTHMDASSRMRARIPNMRHTCTQHLRLSFGKSTHTHTQREIQTQTQAPTQEASCIKGRLVAAKAAAVSSVRRRELTTAAMAALVSWRMARVWCTWGGSAR